MPVRPTYPGVYVQEVPSGVRTIVGVSTSIAAFIGRARLGPMNTPTLCLSFSDFERTFSSDYANSDLARAVRLFFQNGGTQCYVTRIASGATCSSVTLLNEEEEEVLVVKATSPGVAGESIRLAVTYNGLQPESTFNLEIFRWDTNSRGALVKKDTEYWPNLSMDPSSQRYAVDFVNQNSKLVELEDRGVAPDGASYSRSGRPSPTDGFKAVLKELLTGISPVVKGSPWTSTSEPLSSGTYAGTGDETFAFAITAGGTVHTNEITIAWSVGGVHGPDLVLPSDYVAGTPVDVADDLKIAFGSGDLVAGEGFTVSVRVPAYRLRVGVGARAPVDVDLSGVNPDDPLGVLQNTISAATGSPVTATLEVAALGGDDFEFLQIASSSGDVKIEPAASNDLAAPLMFGTAQGGIEVSRYAKCRPAATGVVFRPGDDLANLWYFGGLAQTDIVNITIGSSDITLDLVTGTGGLMYKDDFASSVNGHNDGVREKLAIIATAVNAEASAEPSFKWKAEVWGSRLALVPLDGGDNSVGTIATKTEPIEGYFIKNVRYYSLGVSGEGDYQTPRDEGKDGVAPKLSDYRAAFDVIDKEVDLFNLMVLPADAKWDTSLPGTLWGPASVFCQKRRAFLLMDPPAWKTVQEATNPATGVNGLRIGLVKDYSAIFYPRVTIDENGLKQNVGPSGAIAGLMARIDASRGVWKAPAGTEADLRGVVGLEYRFSDDENGVLNPKAVNTIRVFPNGIVNWGARTMDGDDDFGSEYKYIPVRRLALYMEESLYRGLKWVVFEPNDEPLWAQIRLNVGAFMHDLFRQGAFQGMTPKDAYFVKCDKETTTQSDINQGMVNIWVGFAPLKPAEFVMLYLKQMAGQIQV